MFVVSLREPNKPNIMNKQTVYQLDSNGKVKEWSISVLLTGQAFGKLTSATIIVEHGQVGGAITKEETVITSGKNPGKANETNPFTQAVKEAESKLAAKIRKGYVADQTQLKASTVMGSGTLAPMLAQKYDPTEKQSSSKNLKTLGLEGKRIGVQRKKDGNRGNAHIKREANGITSIKFYTRKGDLLPLNGLEHVADALVASFDKSYDYYNKKYGVTEYTLDGEWFTKAFSFNKLNGLVKKAKKSAEDLADCKHINYHLYDIMLPAGYETRYKIIQNFGSKNVIVEECYFIIATEKEINKYLEMFLEEGEEGLMIRLLDMPYENKRTWQLMKVKLFEDAEFEVVGFEESVKGGMVGAVIVKAPKGCFDRNGAPILTFKAGASFDNEEAAIYWNNQSAYIGTKATVEFFGKSEYGIPRFGKCHKLGRNDK